MFIYNYSLENNVICYEEVIHKRLKYLCVLFYEIILHEIIMKT